MDRPRRAAAKKPTGHYAPTSGIRKSTPRSGPPVRKPRRKKDQSEGDAMSLDSTPADPSQKQGKVKGRAEGDAMDINMPPPARKDPKGKGRSGGDPAPIAAGAKGIEPIGEVSPEALDPAALALDLKNSYEGKILPPVQRPARQQRWKQPATNPIEYLEDVPTGWDSEEPDLDPDDLKSQIARCQERIGDNIMVHQFEFKLKELLREQENRNEIMALERPGLSWPVAQRLKTLNSMSEWLDSKGDEYELAPNVTSLIAAYRSGQLRWNDGLVTYWSKGVQLCQPRPFKWNEYKLISDEHHGQKGFWVEGFQGPGPNHQMMQWLTQPNPLTSSRFAAHMDICLKLHDLPHRRTKAIRLSFLDDTGASLMQINKSDLRSLVNMNIDDQGNLPPDPKVLGIAGLSFANGGEAFLTCVLLEVNMYDLTTSSWLSSVWHQVPVVLMDDSTIKPKLRLNGPWPRFRMYSATAPASECQTYFSDNHPTAMNVPVVSVLDMNKQYPIPSLLPALPPLPTFPP
ncbi:hypothetical protein N7447_009598 [Penicillium robsamsonii]|uniref:uncharacterized protein n=1 Tax=Penicillium robsamsonii TaxID=1792511 RepID=UPI002548FDC4|nr:uncharacterized protein N7447_009598 [Penicillium robsamsonii]KAJ5817365.1 hypothetical protein N7447_009598 [Penicillium robsamsonii]